MIPLEKIRHYVWSLFGAIGIVVFWEGVWGGIGGLPYLEKWWVSLIVGIGMLSFSGIIYKQYDPLENIEKSVHEVLHKINKHPQKEEFHIKYHDRISRKEVIHHGAKLKDFEKGMLVFADKGQEFFLPAHRVTEVLHKGKSFWKS